MVRRNIRHLPSDTSTTTRGVKVDLLVVRKNAVEKGQFDVVLRQDGASGGSQCKNVWYTQTNG